MVNVAAIVEPRKHPALEFVLCNFWETLGWPIHIYHGTENLNYTMEILCRHPEIKKNVTMHDLKVKNLTIKDYNQLLTSVDFYRQLGSDVEYVLIFQTDTMLFPQSPHQMNYFLEGKYDYIGAPWGWLDSYDVSYCGGNGGLSLRNVARMIWLFCEFPFPKVTVDNEDAHICRKPGLRLPPRDVAEAFSTESTFSPTPFGCHKPWLYWTVEEYQQFRKYEPNIDKLIALNFMPGQKLV